MGPFEGIKVLDLTTMVSGPIATMTLADQGADVIKVEPQYGEQLRHMGTPHNGVPAIFYSCNRGKRSIVLDLKSDDGKQILRDLISQSDVLVQNFRPGAMDRMGFSKETIRKLNPKIIYVSISGFGKNGPYAHKRVYDPVIQALSGATDIQADRMTRKPAMFRIIIADKITAITTAQAISAALFHRERVGKGQDIDVSMLESMVSFFWAEGMAGLTYGENEFDLSKEQGTMDLIFATKDGYITAGSVSDKEWKGMCKALKIEQLIDDERFATSQARVRNADVRKAIMAEEIAKWTSAEILARLDENDVPSAPLLLRSELMTHPQIIANDTVVKFPAGDFGEVRQAHPPARFSDTPARVDVPAPQLGEHSRQILLDLGYDVAKSDKLFENKVVFGK